MKERGQQLLEAHLRSFDLVEPTARRRLDDAIGASLAQQLVAALRPTPLPSPGRSVLAV